MMLQVCALVLCLASLYRLLVVARKEGRLPGAHRKRILLRLTEVEGGRFACNFVRNSLVVMPFVHEEGILLQVPWRYYASPLVPLCSSIPPTEHSRLIPDLLGPTIALTIVNLLFRSTLPDLLQYCSDEL